MKVVPIKTKLFNEGANLAAFIKKEIPKLEAGSILVVTSKIVALAERRTAVVKNEKERVRLIKRESQWAMETKYTWLTIKDNMVMASAGIDESNAKGKIILLPKDSFKSAENIRKQIQKIYKVKELGVIITDSRLLPLRAGVVGVALGYAGFKGVKDYRNTPDIFGRKFKFSKTDVADSLATAAVLTMGEGREQQPLAVITDAPVAWTDTIDQNELVIDPAEDVYQPIFENIKAIKKTKRHRK